SSHVEQSARMLAEALNSRSARLYRINKCADRRRHRAPCGRDHAPLEGNVEFEWNDFDAGDRETGNRRRFHHRDTEAYPCKGERDIGGVAVDHAAWFDPM